MPEKIAEWDTTKLTKFIEDYFRTTPPLGGRTLRVDELRVADNLILDEAITFTEEQTSGIGGSAGAMPANPEKYLRVRDFSGAVLVIPAFKAS